MENIFYRTATALALDRLCARASAGPLADLAVRAAVRPGWIDRLTASRVERGLMRQEDEAIATVKSEPVRAATDVALAMTEDAKAARRKADLAAKPARHDVHRGRAGPDRSCLAKRSPSRGPTALP